MAKGNPVIITGTRSPGQDTPETGVRAQHPMATAGVPLKPGVRRYASASPAFRLTLWDVKNTHVNNVVIPGRRAVAQFENGGFETDDKEKQTAIENSMAWKRKQIWNADEMIAAADAAAKEAAIQKIVNNPELMASIRERLAIKDAAQDFSLPPVVVEEVAATS